MSMNDEGDPDFSDPVILKACFEEQDDEIENTAGLAMNALDECAALKAAMLSVLLVLDDRLPGLRSIVADDLADAADRKRREAGLGGPEYDPESCAFLELERDVRQART